MNIFAALAIAAALGAIFSLVSGITSMACNAEVGRYRSEQWMGWRVAFQSAALLFILLAMIASASAGDTRTVAGGGCVYDYRLITDHECRVYRTKVIAAKSDAERIALLNDLEKVMDARARARGIANDDWRGVALAPRAAAPK